MAASTGITVVTLGAQEWQVWRRLRLACLQEAPYAFGSTYQEEAAADEQTWRAKWVREPFSLRLVAYLDSQPAGMCAVVPAQAHHRAPQVISLWVCPPARGRGVADALLAKVTGWARAAGHDAVYLEVTNGNERALRAYERNGFAQTGGTPGTRPAPAGSRLEMICELGQGA